MQTAGEREAERGRAKENNLRNFTLSEAKRLDVFDLVSVSSCRVLLVFLIESVLMFARDARRASRFSLRDDRQEGQEERERDGDMRETHTHRDRHTHTDTDTHRHIHTETEGR